MRNKDGFSIIEISIVLVITGILAFVSFINYIEVYQRSIAETTMQQLKSAIRLAESYAISHNKATCLIPINSNWSNGYNIQICDMENKSLLQHFPAIKKGTLTYNKERLKIQTNGTTSDFGTFTYQYNKQSSKSILIVNYLIRLIIKNNCR